MRQLAAGHAILAHQKRADAGQLIGPLALHGRHHAAFALQQRCGGLVLHVQGEAIVAPDAQHGPFRGAVVASPLRRRARAQVHRLGAEPLAQHDVHHLLRRRIAIAERDFFGQDVDARHRFGRDVLNLRKAGDALAVQQHHRRSIGLGRQFRDHLRYGRDAQGTHIGRGKLLLRLDIADHGAALGLAGDDDLIGIVHLPGLAFWALRLRHQRLRRRAYHQWKQKAGEGTAHYDPLGLEPECPPSRGELSQDSGNACKDLSQNVIRRRTAGRKASWNRMPDP